LTGWGFRCHISQEEKGLDLNKYQIWFIEKMPKHFLVSPDKAPYGVRHFNSVQDIKHLPLIKLFVANADSEKIRAFIDEACGGVIPIMAVQYFHDSTDPGAGQFAWDYIQQKGSYAQPAFRTIISLPREEALKWCRKGLASRDKDVRRLTLSGVAKLGDTKSVPEIIKRLKQSEDNEERRVAIEALGIIGDPRAVPPLIEQLKHGDPEGSSTTFLWAYAREALHRITDVWLSPNGDKALMWWKRNKKRPRWQWLKQGIEQDLFIMDRFQTQSYVAEIQPIRHLEFAACRQIHLLGSSDKARERHRKSCTLWKEWWQQNKHLPQERWVLDSFKEVGHPVGDLENKDSVETLIKILNTEPHGWWHGKPALTWLHHYWCHSFLKRLTGLPVIDSEYFFYTESYIDWKKFGPKWRSVWEKHRDKIEIRLINIPQEQEFVFEKEDRDLLFDHFNMLKAHVKFIGPLMRKKLKGYANEHITGTFEIMVTNGSDNDITIHTKPLLCGRSGHNYGSGGSLSSIKFECTSHEGEFATLKPGESLKWLEQERLNSWGFDERTWLQFRLLFQRSGEDDHAWRGVIRMPWVSVKKEKIIEK
jgi:hypothetical protein